MLVIVIEPRALRKWLTRASQALHGWLSEVVDEAQEELLEGLAEDLRQKLKDQQDRPDRRAR